MLADKTDRQGAVAGARTGLNCSLSACYDDDLRAVR